MADAVDLRCLRIVALWSARQPQPFQIRARRTYPFRAVQLKNQARLCSELAQSTKDGGPTDRPFVYSPMAVGVAATITDVNGLQTVTDASDTIIDEWSTGRSTRIVRATGVYERGQR